MRSKLVKFLAGLFLLLALSFGLLLWKLDPILESFRPEIESFLSEKVQQPVSIGKISLKLFPSPTASVTDVRLQKGETTPTVKQLFLKVSLIPLLSQRLEVSEVGIDGADLRIHRSTDGAVSVNGIALSGGPSGSGRTENSSNSPTPPSVEKKAVVVEVKEAWVKGANFTFNDQAVQPPQEIGITGFNLTLNDISGTIVSHIEGSGQLLSTEPKNFSLSGSVDNNTGSVSLELKSVDLKKLSQLAEAYSKQALPVSLVESANIRAEITLAATGVKVKTRIDADKAGIRVGETFDKPSGDPLQLELEGQASLLGAVELSKLKATLGKNTLEAPLTVRPPADATVHMKSVAFSLENLSKYVPALRAFQPKGELQIDIGATFASKIPKDVSGDLGLEAISITLPTTDEAAEPLLSQLKGNIHFSGTSIDAKSLSFHLAGQPTELAFKAGPFNAPELSMGLKAKELRLQPIVKAVTGKPNPSLEGALFENVSINTNYSVSQKSANVLCEISGGNIANLPLSKTKLVVDATLSPTNELARATLKPSTVSIFGGTATLNGLMNESGLIETFVQANGLNVEQALSTLNPGGKITMSGTLRGMSFKGTAPKEDFAGKLSGTVDATVTKGAIHGFNLLGQTLGKMDQIPGLGAALLAFIPEEHRSVVRSDSTQFDELALQLQINGRDLKIQSVNLTHPLYIVSGQGVIPANGELLIDAQLRLTEALAKGMVQKNPKLKLLVDKNNSIVFPITITKKGGVYLVFPDVSNLGKRALENTARDAATKALDKVTPGLGDALNSLFK